MFSYNVSSVWVWIWVCMCASQHYFRLCMIWVDTYFYFFAIGIMLFNVTFFWSVNVFTIECLLFAKCCSRSGNVAVNETEKSLPSCFHIYIAGKTIKRVKLVKHQLMLTPKRGKMPQTLKVHYLNVSKFFWSL